jgi:hypothetical protein
VVFQAVDQVGAVLIRQFAKAKVEVGDGVECIGQLDIENDFIWEQHGDGPMQAFRGVDANGENRLRHGRSF